MSGSNATPEAWCPLLFCSSDPVSLSGLPCWTAESIRRGPGGERIQRAQQSVSSWAEPGRGQQECRLLRLSVAALSRPQGSAGLEAEEEEEEEEDVPEWQQEFDEELDNDSFSYDEESENLDRETFFFGDEDDDDESYD